MKISSTLGKTAVVAVLAAGAVLVDDGNRANAQVPGVPVYEQVYVPARYKVRVNGRRVGRGIAMVPAGVAPLVVAPTAAYVPAPAVAFTETRYVPTVSVVERVVTRAPVVTRTYVQAPPLVETRYIQPSPVVETRYVQPLPAVERVVEYPY